MAIWSNQIQVFSAKGDFLEAWTDIGKPWGLALGKDGFLYMTDGDAELILKPDLEGNIAGRFEKGAGTGPGQFKAVHGIAAGPGGTLS